MQNFITKHVEYENMYKNEPLYTDQKTNHTSKEAKKKQKRHEIIQSYCIASIYRFR